MTALVLTAALFAGVDGSHWERLAVDQLQRAVRVSTVQVGQPTSTLPAWPTVSGPCSEWADVAFDAGWPVQQWPTISRVMFCESKCQPKAYNRSGASGLMQVMPGWHKGRDPFDPATNLAMAREVWERQGWHAWSCF